MIVKYKHELKKVKIGLKTHAKYFDSRHRDPIYEPSNFILLLIILYI